MNAQRNGSGEPAKRSDRQIAMLGNGGIWLFAGLVLLGISLLFWGHEIQWLRGAYFLVVMLYLGVAVPLLRRRVRERRQASR